MKRAILKKWCTKGSKYSELFSLFLGCCAILLSVFDDYNRNKK